MMMKKQKNVNVAACVAALSLNALGPLEIGFPVVAAAIIAEKEGSLL